MEFAPPPSPAHVFILIKVRRAGEPISSFFPLLTQVHIQCYNFGVDSFFDREGKPSSSHLSEPVYQQREKSSFISAQIDGCLKELRHCLQSWGFLAEVRRNGEKEEASKFCNDTMAAAAPDDAAPTPLNVALLLDGVAEHQAMVREMSK